MSIKAIIAQQILGQLPLLLPDLRASAYSIGFVGSLTPIGVVSFRFNIAP